MGTELRRTLALRDGLAMNVGIMVGAGIFRTPGLIAAQLGRPWLVLIAWMLGGVVAFAGAMIFAELGTRHPRAGGKYVYAREAFGPRVAFVFAVVEIAIYAAGIAALASVAGEYAVELAGWPGETARLAAAAAVVLFTAINLFGVAEGRRVQNVVTAIKVVALVGAIGVAVASGTGAGWGTTLPNAPTGISAVAALALASQSVIWAYYGYPDAAKIAEEVIDPGRTLPRIYLWSIAIVMLLYLMFNAAFIHLLPFEAMASSNLVARDAAVAIVGPRGGIVISALALVVVLAACNGNVFVIPRVGFALARDGLAPRVFAKVNRGGTPWTSLLVVGAAATALAATGTFDRLLSIAIALILIIDGATAVALVVLRRREPASTFAVPWFWVVTPGFIAIYAVLLAVAVIDAPSLAVFAGATIGGAGVLAMIATRRA